MRTKTLIALLLICSTTFAANIYVDGTLGANITNGTYSIANRDNSGSDGNAYMTIQGAATACAAGDTIYVRGATYSPAARILFSNKAGTDAAHKITLRPYASESVVIDGTSTPSSSSAGLISVSASAYVVIRDLTIQNYPYWLVYCYGGSSYGEIYNVTLTGAGTYGVEYTNSDYCTVHYCIIHGCGAAGILFRGSSYGTIDRNEVYDCARGAQTVYRTTSNCNYMVISNNIFHDMTTDPENADGMTCSSGTYYEIVRGNIAYNNLDDGIDCSASGVDPSDSYGVLLNNICFNNGDPEDVGDGNGMKMSTNSGGGHLMIGNVVFSNRTGGFNQDKEDGWPANYFYHNTSYAAGSHGFAWDAHPTNPSEAVMVCNNVAYDSTFDDCHSTAVSSTQWSDYNFFGDGTGPDDGNDTHSLTGDPKFADASAEIDTTFPDGYTIDQKLAYIRDQVQAKLSLSATSTCLNAGTFPTTITSTTGSGTSFVVGDPNWFYDGYGISGETGAAIKTSAGQSATITDIDKETNAITVDTSISWTQGDGITLTFNGTGPDIGAYESAANSFGADANCVAAYRLESTLTTDSIGTNTLTNNGVDANAVDFKEGAGAGRWVTANSDYMTIADASLDAKFPLKNGDTNKLISVTGWFDPNTFGPGSGDTRVIFQKGTTGGSTASFRIDVQTYGSEHYFRIGIGRSGAPANFDYYAHDSLLSANTWYFFGVDYNDIDKSYRLHLATASGTVGTDKTGTASNNIYVGEGAVYVGSDSTTGFDGLIDELAIFNDILDPNEMIAIKQGRFPAGPIPEVATTPSPEDEATGVSQTPTLTWADGGGATSYDVYFGTTATPTLVSEDQAGDSYEPAELDAGTQYWWKVVGKNENGSATGSSTWTFTTGFPEGPGTYYVEPVNGSDSNAGRPITQPWKTLAYAVTQLSPGDTLLMRDGLYEETVDLEDVSGTDGSPITIQAYTGETPIITTSVAVTGWTQCTAEDANLVRGAVTHPNATSIYVAKVTGDCVMLYENRRQLQYGTFPTTTHADWFRVEEMHAVADEGGNFGQKAYLVDSTHFTQADDYWNGASIKFWMHAANNWLSDVATVSDFDAASDKITLASSITVSGTPTNLSKDYSLPDAYVIYNHPMLIAGAGQWCSVSLGGGRTAIYCWPTDANDLTADMRRSDSSTNGFTMYANKGTSGSYLIVDGLTIENSLSGFKLVDCGPVVDFQIKNFTFKQASGVGLYLYSLSNGLVEDCNITNSNENGMQIGLSTGVAIRQSNVAETLGTGIYLAGSTTVEISDCNIGETGTHGNGISPYQNSTDVLIARCTITTPKVSVTVNEANNVTLFANLIVKDVGGASGFADWADCNGVRNIINCTFLGCNAVPYGTGGASGTSIGSLNIVNCIMADATFNDATVHLNNIYLDTPGHELNASESVAASQGSVLTAGYLPLGAALATGTPVTSYLPTDKFPSFDFTKGLNGTAWRALMDRGANARTSDAGVAKPLLMLKVNQP